jgi:adenine phosphoribosyltransferase
VPGYCRRLFEGLKDMQIDAIAGVESRGFLFGLTLATKLGVPFIPVRKAGKLPHTVKQKVYELEYGTATIESTPMPLNPATVSLFMMTLLATGGTVTATSELIQDMGGVVAGFTFVVGLGFLNGLEKIPLSVITLWYLPIIDGF